MPTLRIAVNSSQGRKAVPYWAKFSYDVEPDQITQIKKVGDDGCHQSYKVTYTEAKKETT